MPSRDVNKAREAYRNGDPEQSRLVHQANGPEEEHRQEHGRYIKSIIYGGLDGIITPFAVVAGVNDALDIAAMFLARLPQHQGRK